MRYNKKMNFAIAMIVIGIIFALRNIFGIDIFAGQSYIDWNQLWPVALIGLGIYFIWKKSK